ncbi:HXXEE domain-containing protein [Fructobacillus sp. M1-13]|uniref:HXXEE domain-containing protein n=1 Tax=Fructobacillus papyriferae TaxID=2713171 RepID=A0ABS5QND2_9LACO|nr:HXXEE domain-containing protein [Fructobacillus papyriferae]MBS9334618.1 HXXEE domain-containing protein [Fructobacillus papyriferae]MCD2158608.1 HXXEE domain-containing protein [Fructobacillus papyriferae]
MFFIKNWYRFGAALFIALAIFLLANSGSMTNVQVIAVLNLLALFAHQFEEYQLPGGAPMIINRVVYDETKLADRYPGNSLSIMVVNVSAWIIYLFAILFSNLHWLVLGVTLFSLFQILGHVLQMNIKLKVWYNPGLATTVFLFFPLGTYSIVKMSSLGFLNGTTWFFAVLILVACIGITIVAPVQLLKDKGTKYVISSWQQKRFHQILSKCSVRMGK